MSAACAAPAGTSWACPDGRLILRADAPRELWLAARTRGIGSSDASAVLGVNRWTSAYEVWAEKRGLTTGDDDNEAMELGRELEPIIVARWSRRSGIPIRKAGLMANRALPWQLASVDRLAGCGGIVEAKTLSYRVAEEWDDGQTPDHAEAQSQHQMAVTGRDHVHVVGLQDGRTWLERTVARDDALIADMTKVEAEMWRLIVEGVEPPIDGSPMTTEVLNQRWPAIEDVETELGPDAVELIAAAQGAKADAAHWVLEADRLGNELRRLMGEATIGWLPGDPDDPDRKRVIYRRNGTFRVKAFTADHPDTAAAITHPIPALDVDALKGGQPDLYATYRARQLRVPKL